MTNNEWYEKFKEAYMKHFKLTEAYLSANDEVILKIAKKIK